MQKIKLLTLKQISRKKIKEIFGIEIKGNRFRNMEKITKKDSGKFRQKNNIK